MSHCDQEWNCGMGCDCDGSSRYRYSVDELVGVLNAIDLSAPESVSSTDDVHWRGYEVPTRYGTWTVMIHIHRDHIDYIDTFISPRGDKIKWWLWDDHEVRSDYSPIDPIMFWGKDLKVPPPRQPAAVEDF